MPVGEGGDDEPEASKDKYGLEVGMPGIESVGSFAFDPGRVLFVADNVRATNFAIDVGDSGAASQDVAGNDVPVADQGITRENVNKKEEK